MPAIVPLLGVLKSGYPGNDRLNELMERIDRTMWLREILPANRFPILKKNLKFPANCISRYRFTERFASEMYIQMILA